MIKFKVLTDSTSDMEKSFRERSGVDYLKMVFTQKGRDYAADLDWGEISGRDYYEAMRKGARAITGLINVDECETKLRNIFSEGYDVLYVACSSKLSNSLQTAEIIAKDLQKEYPERKAVCFDSLRSNYAEGMIAMAAAALSDEGKSIDEAVAILEEEKLKYQTHATVDTLEFLSKAGRVKASAAFFGNLFGVKPIILGDAKGNNYAYKKVRGRKASLDELINIVAENIVDPEKRTVFVEHADCIDDAKYVAEGITKNVPNAKINISYVGPIIGAAIGPGAITVNFYGKKVTIYGE
ncbi:MAG: DegV family protein [Clostridia bacterium]|nr:DegV family protein [Clostridia bacterium]